MTETKVKRTCKREREKISKTNVNGGKELWNEYGFDTVIEEN